MTTANVLHVSNRWGGGVKSVVQQYVSALPDYTHFLARTNDPWVIPGRDPDLFEMVAELPSGMLLAGRALASLIDKLQIDIIHAHSSLSGALMRMLPRRCELVYTPHAFATLAPRGSRLWWAGQAEWVLGLRHIRFATVSDAEADLARRYSKRSDIVRILNLPAPGLLARTVYKRPARVTMCGRICPQKDPAFFASTARLARKSDPLIQFEWIGDGDQSARLQLEDAGVVVTGWLDQKEVHSRLAASTVYLHSAVYEGACLSVLDAAALGVPSIGRPMPGVEEVPWLKMARTPTQAASIILSLSDNEEHWRESRAATLTSVGEMTTERQRTQLLNAYGIRDSRRQRIEVFVE